MGDCDEFYRCPARSFPCRFPARCSFRRCWPWTIWPSLLTCRSCSTCFWVGFWCQSAGESQHVVLRAHNARANTTKIYLFACFLLHFYCSYAVSIVIVVLALAVAVYRSWLCTRSAELLPMLLVALCVVSGSALLRAMPTAQAAITLYLAMILTLPLVVKLWIGVDKHHREASSGSRQALHCICLAVVALAQLALLVINAGLPVLVSVLLAAPLIIFRPGHFATLVCTSPLILVLLHQYFPNERQGAWLASVQHLYLESCAWPPWFVVLVALPVHLITIISWLVWR